MAIFLHLVHSRFCWILQNTYKLVIVHPEALCEDVGWHDVALVGHDADDYHHGGQNLVKSLLVTLSDQRTATCYFSGHLLNLCEVFSDLRKR
jgi:hypothetical protein